MISVKDTHKEKVPLNETPALTKIMNMDVWVVDNHANTLLTLKEVLNLKQNFQTNEVVIGKSPFFEIDPFYTSHSICLNTGF